VRLDYTRVGHRENFVLLRHCMFLTVSFFVLLDFCGRDTRPMYGKPIVAIVVCASEGDGSFVMLRTALHSSPQSLRLTVLFMPILATYYFFLNFLDPQYSPRYKILSKVRLQRRSHF